MTAVPSLEDLDSAGAAGDDPIIYAWKHRERIKNGWAGFIAVLLVGSFVTGAWWWGVATKSWVTEHVSKALGVEAHERKIDEEKIEGIRIDVGIIKAKVQSLERDDERMENKLQRVYEDMGAFPEVRRERRRREREAMEESEADARPPDRPR